jgi:hypothetical protein
VSKNIFNYFQYEYTGGFETSGYNVTPYISGGFSGFYTPSDILSGDGTKRVFEIISEVFLWPTNYQIELKGDQVSSNKDTTSLNFSFFGDFIPYAKESGSLSFNFTGQQVQCPFDKPNFNVNFSGQQNSPPRDNINYTAFVSGDYGIASSDKPNLNVYFSGDFYSTLLDRPLFTLFFSGGFKKTNKDIINLNLVPSGIVWTLGNLLQIFYYSDSSFIDFKPQQIIWGTV